MSGSSEILWSDDPCNTAWQIPDWLHLYEKTYFVRTLIGSVLYGISIILFFRCIGALLNPANHMGKRVRWGLVAHTVALFFLATAGLAIETNTGSISYIDNRIFSDGGELPPGPSGYWISTGTSRAAAFSTATFPLSQWLADGLLLHRCWVIYAMNYWVVAFSSLVYLASIATGIAYIHESQKPGWYYTSGGPFDSIVSYHSISLSLNILLTLAIIVQIFLHARNIRDATGAYLGGVGSHAAYVVTILVESYALYAVSYLLYLILAAANSPSVEVFSTVLVASQVIAPFLVTVRIAERRALTRKIIDSGSGEVGSICLGSQGGPAEPTGSEGDDQPTSIETTAGQAPGKSDVHGAEAENTKQEVPSSE